MKNTLSMNAIEEIKEELKNVVKKDLKKGIQNLLDLITNRTLNNKVNLQSFRLNKLKGHNEGIITFDNYDAELNQIFLVIFELIDEITDEEDLNSSLTEIGRAISDLDITKELRIISLLNCDRTKEYEIFFGNYDDDKNQFSNQFFFIPACGYQRSEDFVERIILQIKELLDGEHNKSIVFNDIDYKPVYGKKPLKRLSPFQVQLNSRIDGKIEYRRFLRDRFNATEENIKEVLKESSINYSFQAHLLKFTHWSEYALDFCKKIVTDFQKLDDIDSTVLFFFEIRSDRHYCKPGNDIDLGIQKFVETHQEVFVINGFEPACHHDIEEWFDVHGVTKLIERDKVINLFKSKHRIDEMDKQRKIIDMERIRELLEMTYSIHSNL